MTWREKKITEKKVYKKKTGVPNDSFKTPILWHIQHTEILLHISKGALKYLEK